MVNVPLAAATATSPTPSAPSPYLRAAFISHTTGHSPELPMGSNGSSYSLNVGFDSLSHPAANPPTAPPASVQRTVPACPEPRLWPSSWFSRYESNTPIHTCWPVTSATPKPLHRPPVPL